MIPDTMDHLETTVRMLLHVPRCMVIVAMGLHWELYLPSKE